MTNWHMKSVPVEINGTGKGRGVVFLGSQGKNTSFMYRAPF